MVLITSIILASIFFGIPTAALFLFDKCFPFTDEERREREEKKLYYSNGGG